jgi:hypothetical protein
MSNAKEQVKELLEVLPDNASFDDIHYHLFIREKVDQGIKELSEGKVVSEQEMEANFKKWLDE